LFFKREGIFRIGKRLKKKRTA